KKENQVFDETKGLYKIRNQSFRSVFNTYILSSPNSNGYITRSGYPYRPIALFDETGIEGNVDINIWEVTDDTGDVATWLRKRLSGTGLTVEETVRKIKMLVLSDSL